MTKPVAYIHPTELSSLESFGFGTVWPSPCEGPGGTPSSYIPLVKASELAEQRESHARLAEALAPLTREEILKMDGNRLLSDEFRVTKSLQCFLIADAIRKDVPDVKSSSGA